VQVRVLIDDVGSRYARPTMVRLLRRAGVRAAAFLPTNLPRLFRYANLRNHRKILAVDGTLGFTGGMNIRESHWLGCGPPHPATCLHFRVAGPVVGDLQRTFAVDWAFTTGEQLHGEDWFPRLEACATMMARGVPDGPDADLDNIPHLIHGALSAATRRVRIVTPYFLPDGVLLCALQVAAMRGVEVEIVLPSISNLPIIDWAMVSQLPGLLDKGCRIYLTPPPFDHTKLLVVDSFWSLIGSTNWDARSLRLNFEYNLECYDESLARRLDSLIDAKTVRARQLAPGEGHGPLAVRLRNGLARLLTPYL
jgi:cardiolipin synthase A/B